MPYNARILTKNMKLITTRATYRTHIYDKLVRVFAFNKKIDKTSIYQTTTVLTGLGNIKRVQVIFLAPVCAAFSTRPISTIEGVRAVEWPTHFYSKAGLTKGD